jgi:aryl-alcohol dehydrogenase-like predicted oxidoreductase
VQRKAILAEFDISCAGWAPTTSTCTSSTAETPSTPIKETLQAPHDVVAAGKVRYLGASSMWSWQFAKALYLQERHGWHRFVSMQDHYNLLYREEEREMLPLCSAEGIAVTPWSPLARGKLTRDWDATTNRSETDEFGKTLYRDSDAQIVEAVAPGRGASRRLPRPGRAGVGGARSRRDLSNCRRHEAAPARRCPRRHRAGADR